MKRPLFFIIVACLCLLTKAQTIGQWKAYMAYHDVTEVCQAGQTYYVLASNNLYSYNEHDQSLQTYDKVNGLSDCAIAHIAWCQAAKRLVIAYKNQNIDLLNESQTVTNLPDYYLASTVGSKTINSIYINEGFAYLATGFGIVKLNVQRAEVADTYNLGFNTNYCYLEGDYLYAASAEEGLYRGNVKDNLLDKKSWSRVGDYVAKNDETDPEILKKIENLNPGGPKYNHFAFMRFMNNRLYTCGGGYGAAVELNRPGCIQVLSDDEWVIYQDDFAATQTPGVSYIDVMSLDIDPKNSNRLFASGRTGVYEFLNGKFQKHYSYDNSTLSSVFGNDPNYVVVESIKFDTEGNLYCFVCMSIAPNIAVLKTDGKWESYDRSELKDDLGNLDHMQNIISDSRGLFWWCNNTWTQPALICYQPTTSGLNCIKSFINQDGTTVQVNGGVKCVVEDLNGDMWVGTNAGPLLLPQSEIANTNPVFMQVKVPRNDGTNYADYLLSGVDITAMVIDGGNRKWFGTNGSGVYVIDSDNITEVYHFTEENSPLLSNYIESMAMNKTTGEIFFGTNNGLCSYMSDAAEGNDNMSDDSVYAYPNPVRPDYSGLITITGLSYDSDVKIVTSNGVLVNQGRSTGGMYTWDGCDLKGKRVASGVYMVETATATGKKGTVCKIAIVR